MARGGGDDAAGQHARLPGLDHERRRDGALREQALAHPDDHRGLEQAVDVHQAGRVQRLNEPPAAVHLQLASGQGLQAAHLVDRVAARRDGRFPVGVRALSVELSTYSPPERSSSGAPGPCTTPSGRASPARFTTCGEPRSSRLLLRSSRRLGGPMWFRPVADSSSEGTLK